MYVCRLHPGFPFTSLSTVACGGTTSSCLSLFFRICDMTVSVGQHKTCYPGPNPFKGSISSAPIKREKEEKDWRWAPSVLSRRQ